MKHARKLASLLLALVMVFALATTAFATETEGTTTTPTGSITVNNPQNETTYTAYKIFDVVYDEATPKHYSYTIEGGSEWFSTVETYAKTEGSGLTLTLVKGTTTYVVTTTDTFSAPEFAAALKNGLTETIKGTPLTAGTGNKPTATGLALGYYFVTSSTGALCSLDTTNPDVTIYDKNDMPFEKEVNTPSADVGQTVTFTITGKVPEHTIFTDYTYEITDTMSEGLTFNRDSLTVEVGSDVVTADTGKCTIAYDAKTAPNTFKVTILVKNCTVGDAITVTYTATVNEKAIAKIATNEAKLTYSNDSTKKTTTPAQKQEVYTSKIVIEKYEKGTDTMLEGAEFVLCRKAPNNEPQVATVLNDSQNANQKAIQNQYYKQDKTTKAVSWVNDIADATKVTTNANGKAFFEGLADGEYLLVETKAPAGYNRMTTGQIVEVKGGTTEAQLSVTAKVENQAGTLLPSTGGVGTTVFYVLGAILVLGAVVLLVTKKRMNDANR